MSSPFSRARASASDQSGSEISGCSSSARSAELAISERSPSPSSACAAREGEKGEIS
eukprot:CAMPEP_0118840642 /NCGR_PEP_ID=MMETSP1162-20130426/73578_1 /TAXON_ID=33656 /ORGANISM="Phaeocystis Sp, Strain CCMP2710" /LENGTH=56 /DNA_ID=CAMNT_0006772661 /DNA_START=37 /DNA_END=203 /DNA_ORIENTATION=+